MSVITFISHDGEKYETPLEEGQSLMQIAISNLIPGIDGDCGGEAACGTCHVVVDEGWVDVGGRSTPVEEEMLSMNPERESTSRLACQMTMSEGCDGLVVRLPEFQM